MSTSAEWGVQLLGHPFDLGFWEDVFKPPFDPWLFSQEGRFILRWSGFKNCENAEEVRDAATPLLERLNGITEVTSDARPVRFEDIVVFNPDGTRKSIMIAGVGAYEMRMGRSRARGVGEAIGPDGNVIPAIPTPSEAQNWLAASRRLELLADAAVYFSRGGWFDIYKAVECLRAEFGGEVALKNRGWISADKLDNMKQTANSHRHFERGKHKPPASPVTLAEARQLLRILIRKAFEERL